jgi:hypothetical protein
MFQRTCITVGLVCLLSCVTPAVASSIYGDYVESRSADVYTGPCFANAEVGLTGNEATLAWRIRKGQWEGVTLDGLTVVAVARANATLGDPYHDPYPAVSVLIIDSRADDAQRNALMSFAKTMGGRLLDNVRLVHFAPIAMEVGEGHDHGSIHLHAGDMAEIRTRSLNDKDHYCGNEETYYPPLTELSHAMPAVAVTSQFIGKDLGVEWKIFDKRCAFVGSFSKDVALITETH